VLKSEEPWTSSEFSSLVAHWDHHGCGIPNKWGGPCMGGSNVPSGLKVLDNSQYFLLPCLRMLLYHSHMGISRFQSHAFPHITCFNPYNPITLYLEYSFYGYGNRTPTSGKWQRTGSNPGLPNFCFLNSIRIVFCFPWLSHWNVTCWDFC
jgi:hypothetical protein